MDGITTKCNNRAPPPFNPNNRRGRGRGNFNNSNQDNYGRNYQAQYNYQQDDNEEQNVYKLSLDPISEEKGIIDKTSLGSDNDSDPEIYVMANNLVLDQKYLN